MPERAKPFLVFREDDPQLQLLNEKIARLAAATPSATTEALAPLHSRLTWRIWPSEAALDDVPAGPVSHVLCESHRKKHLEANARYRRTHPCKTLN
jgi:hypothetical protein